VQTGRSKRPRKRITPALPSQYSELRCFFTNLKPDLTPKLESKKVEPIVMQLGSIGFVCAKDLAQAQAQAQG
jgi:hypothetical protein